MNKRKIISIITIILVVIGMCFYQTFKEIDSINRGLEEKNYEEKDVVILENILKEYFEGDYTDEEMRKSLIYHLMLNYYEEKDYYPSYYSDVENYINEVITAKKNDNNTYNYHDMAISYLEIENEDEVTHTIANEIRDVKEQMDSVLIFVCNLAYVIVFIKFIFNKFDKKTYIKNTIIYVVSLISIFAFNIICSAIFDKLINYFGHYKGIGFFQYFNLPCFLDYGVISILQLLIIFIVGLIIYNLINIKEVIKYFKKK